jgi:hypothetical protein
MRIRSRRGHLCNRDCADLAAELAGQGMKNLLLAHISEANNFPDLAYDEAFGALAGYDVNLRVASPIDVTMLVGETDQPLPTPIKVSAAGGLPTRKTEGGIRL